MPHWVRGAESLELLSPRHQSLPMLGLGISVGTPAEGIEADLLVVDSFVELERRQREARGKIVLFNDAVQGLRTDRRLSRERRRRKRLTPARSRCSFDPSASTASARRTPAC